MVALVVDVFLGVFSRYVLQATFQWYDEVARLCFVWTVFLGAAVAVRRGTHFRLHLLIDRVGARPRRAVDVLVTLIVMAFGGVLVTGGLAIAPIARRQVTDALEISMLWFYGALPVGGALGMAVVAAEYIFSGISGSTVADVSAVAATTIPGMVRAGYSPELAVAIVSSASAMGILVPPCILMIVIGSVASLSVAALFTAGFAPAVVLALALMVYVWWRAGESGIAAEPVPTVGALGRALAHALIPLGMPAIIFGGILGGIMTPTEASVLAVLYAAIVGLFVYREIKWRDLPEIVVKSAMVTGAVGLLLGTAGLVSWFLTVQQMPATLIRLMTVVPGSSTVFLFATAVIFVFFGAVIEGPPAVVILLPSLLPVAAGLGIDPIHYAIVIVAAVGIGSMPSPIGDRKSVV